MPVRTKLLASGRSSSATSSVVYTVPTDETCIWKFLRLANVSATTSTEVIVAVDTAANNQTTYLRHTLAAQTGAMFDLWQVLQPGMEIAISNVAAVGVNYWLSGSELEGVAD